MQWRGQGWRLPPTISRKTPKLCYFRRVRILLLCLSKMRGMSQEQLAEKSGVSRSHISAIEAPGLVRPFSLDVFFNIADALQIDPADLIDAAVFPDKIFKK